MSFPAATLILSNSVSKEHQGIAASLVATIVNYSISLGLGFAGTVEVHLNRGGRTPQDILRGYRGAFYLGIGLAGLGMLISSIFLLRSYWRDRKAMRSSQAPFTLLSYDLEEYVPTQAKQQAPTPANPSVNLTRPG